MKVIYTRETNTTFVNGMVYDVEINGDDATISVCGVVISTMPKKLFNETFEEQNKEEYPICFTAVYNGDALIDQAGFTEGNRYQFKQESKHVIVTKNDNKKLCVFDEGGFRHCFSKIEENETPDKEKQYMVLVENGTTPKKIHNSLDSVENEAKRLAGLPSNLGKKVSILEVVKSFKSLMLIEEV